MIDLQVYEALAVIMEAEMAGLVADFLASTDALLSDLAAAEAAADAPAVKRHAHSIKSSAAVIGAMRLSELAQAMEAQAATGRCDGLGPACAAMRREFTQAGAELVRLGAVATAD